MRVYHFIDSKYGLENIRNRQLKISNLMKLNDPFELLSVNTSEKDFRQAILLMKEELSINQGIICFSASWRSPVQWAHYADSHKGICLGFDIPKKYLSKIIYTPRRFDAPKNLNEKFMKKLLCTKFTHWKYEAEHRLWAALNTEESGFYFREFDNDLKLKQVIVGAESKLTRQNVSDALGGLKHEVKVFKTRPAFSTFKIVEQRNRKLWA